MATVVELPRLSDTMEEGVVAKWLVKVGDRVKRGQVIAEIETDKATMEFESFDAGTVLLLVASEGSTLKLGSPIAVLGKDGEDEKAAKAALAAHGSGGAAGDSAAGGGDGVPEAKRAAEPAPAPVPSPSAGAAAPAVAKAAAPAAAPQVAKTSSDGDGRVPASPLARRLAREAGLPLASIAGSGPHGRVIKQDIDAAVAAGGPSASPSASGGASVGARGEVSYSAEVDEHGRPYASHSDVVTPLSQMRKAVVRAMVKSKTEAPHFYLTIDVDMEAAARFRSEFNVAVDGVKLSFNDLVVATAAKTLRKHPRVNAKYTDAGLVRFGDIHIGIAVALDDGLIVPVVRHAEQKSLKAVSLEIRDLGKRAKTKQLRPAEMSGSTFSVSNLGMFGIEEFLAVVNPGEGAILAVGAVRDTVVAHAGAVVVRKRMKVTLSCDHRVVDGADGARYLADLKAVLEQPARLFT